MDYTFRYSFDGAVFDSEDVGPNELMTDSSGYIDVRQRVEEMVAAGERLSDYRRDMYADHRHDEDWSEPLSPLARKDYDFDDAHEDIVRLTAKAKKSKAAEVTTPPPSASPPPPTDSPVAEAPKA